jgi:hypothetical protein
MSDPLASYSFLPWLRRGLASQITRDDGAVADPPVPRASIALGMTFNNDPGLSTSVTLGVAGPGEAAGIDPRVVVRVVPQRDVHDAEPNYFPFVELAQADLPWRYTPARASGERLTPWIALICLPDAEITDYLPAAPDRELAIVTVSDGSALPPWDQLWAWAHAQLSDSATVDEATAANILANEPRRLVSRVLCPRRLNQKTAYRAFLVPTFERGRLAGLDEVTDATDALEPAWDDQVVQHRLPVYYEWRFETGVQEDFEYLVRQLKPFVAPKEVGIRDMDVAGPGMAMPPAAPHPLGLEGALKTELTESTTWPATERTTFLDALRPLLNLPTTMLTSGITTPVVAPPLYARWHAARETVDPGDTSPWFHDLNVDPRLRVLAGLGTQVVQSQQRPLMASAWEQVKRIREINEELRQKQLARLGATSLHTRMIDLPEPDAVLRLAASVLARIKASPRTVDALIKESPIARGAMEAQMRRVARPLGPLGGRQGRPGRPAGPGLLDRMNRGELSPARVPTTPTGMFTPARAPGGSLLPTWVTPFLISIVSALPRWLFILAVLLLLVAVVLWFMSNVAIAAWLFGAALIVAVVGWVLRRLARDWRRRVAVRDGTLRSEHVRDAPPRPDFAASEPPAGGVPPAPQPMPPGADAGDSPSAKAFRDATVAMLDKAQAAPLPGPQLRPVDLVGLRNKVVAALHPAITIERAVSARLHPGPGVQWSPADPLQEVMAAPEFPQPMYEPLRDLGQDWLLPGLELVPQNSISLLLTNQPFIEAYMAGLSHEMARELRWHEYPTDQRGTYFRQFWDVRGYVPPPDTTIDPESMLDITRIHTWPRSSTIGSHPARQLPPGGAHLVLLVRGELLRRYPNTLVYAVKAKRGGEKRDLGTEEKHPIFRGTLKPDVTFFGFELTADEARGGTGYLGDPGWFFVLQEQPTEPRFGFDIAEPPQFGTVAGSWDGLSWAHFAVDADALGQLGYIDLTSALPDTKQAEAATPGIIWDAAPAAGRGSRASDLAYITLQLPVRIGIHGSRMLPPAT